MQKVVLFSLFLILGLVASQTLPDLFGTSYAVIKTGINTMLFICLAFIMINVGREFEIDKKRWRSYSKDYFVAMSAAAFPWIFVAIYFVFVLLPSNYWFDSEAWKENLLLSRFAAPTSAGILFTMLAAAGLKATWVYKKIQVLAIFDDLDTILLMIPLQIMMVGLRWQLFIIVFIVTLLLVLAWKKLSYYDIPQGWKAIMTYALIVFSITQFINLSSTALFGELGAVHIEVLLPAFVLGMIMKTKHTVSSMDVRVTDGISYLFMLLVGMSMPLFLGIDFEASTKAADTITGSQPMMSSGMIALHVLVVTLLSNLGKLFPLATYKDRQFKERLALSVGMFTRGEVGAGIIFISIGYNLGGPALIISVLTLVVNLVLTGFFVVWVKRLTQQSVQEQTAS
jgi:hypothetical protein